MSNNIRKKILICGDSFKLSPWFHVEDEKIQTSFANECLHKINNIKELTC